MAIVKTVEVRGENGNGCGKDFVDPIEIIFCNFGAALTEMAGKVGGEALANVSAIVKASISPERALTFAQAVTAKDMMDALYGGLERQRSPLAPELLAAASRARKETLTVVYDYYSNEGSEQKMISLAQAIREQFDKIR